MNYIVSGGRTELDTTERKDRMQNMSAYTHRHTHLYMQVMYQLIIL